MTRTRGIESGASAAVNWALLSLGSGMLFLAGAGLWEAWGGFRSEVAIVRSVLLSVLFGGLGVWCIRGALQNFLRGGAYTAGLDKKVVVVGSIVLVTLVWCLIGMVVWFFTTDWERAGTLGRVLGIMSVYGFLLSLGGVGAVLYLHRRCSRECSRRLSGRP